MATMAGKLGGFFIGGNSQYVLSVHGGQPNWVVAFDTHPITPPDPYTGSMQTGLQLPPGVRLENDGSLTYLLLIQNVDAGEGGFDLCYMIATF
jgi:hypothetical protein